MTYSASAIAYWVGKFNAELALYTSQVAATTAEHNAQYVNGAGTGATWAAQDAADVAAAAAAAATAATALTAETNLYNAQVIATAAATPPAAAQRAIGTLSGSGIGAETTATISSLSTNTLGASLVSNAITLPKAGAYTITIAATLQGTSPYPNNQSTIRLKRNGSTVATITPVYTDNSSQTLPGIEYQATLASSDGITVTCSAINGTVTIGGSLTITFIPTTANPH